MVGILCSQCVIPDSKVLGANVGPTWVLSAPGGPHVGPMNLAIRDVHQIVHNYVNTFCLLRCVRYYSICVTLHYWNSIERVKPRPPRPEVFCMCSFNVTAIEVWRWDDIICHEILRIQWQPRDNYFGRHLDIFVDGMIRLNTAIAFSMVTQPNLTWWRHHLDCGIW